mmetsp:Transcript_57991/g.172397  ORF Transcript_57991/g.172397 Transcript_57991/m.172397 type:complete len:149 (-) Transcript_57991:343-789(-)
MHCARRAPRRSPGSPTALMARRVPLARVTFSAPQSFYVQYVRRVNLDLDRWAGSCLPGRLVHLPLQRVVALTNRTPECVDDVIAPLIAALRLNRSDATRAARAFVRESYRLVVTSIREARAKPILLAPSINASWPRALEPSSCSGPLL